MTRSPFPGGGDSPFPRSPADGLELDVVHAYTRRQAIADGVLVDVSRQASPAEMYGGFLVPVAVTAALWHAIERIPPSLTGIADARGRLHDVLWMASLALRRAGEHAKEANGAPSPTTGDPFFALFVRSQDAASTESEGTFLRYFASFACSHATTFAVHLPIAGTRKRVQTLRADVGPDDDGKPCVTIGLPEDF